MTDSGRYPLLEQLRSPADLHDMDAATLQRLNDQLRALHLESVAATGGHLGAGLGAVELTVALHAVFDTPDDRIVWDVGHQSYPHKILTGRRERMDTMRKWRGLAGFPKRDESEYDTFGTGHSSTSISAALGMAVAAKQRGEDRQVVAVIGDGAMTAGMAFEALNHAGDLDANLLIILNDNNMSISPNVGALNKYLTRMLSGRMYSQAREGGKKVLRAMPPFWELARRTEEHVKGMFVPGTMFEEFGFHYYGPVDGHDLGNLVKTLRNLRELEGPRLLHIVTAKGKGYERAESDPVSYHGVKPFDPATGRKLGGASKPTGPAYTEVFGQWLCDMAARDERIVGITPAMREGSGLVEFEKRFPDRYFDTGIAEQHAVTFAAGLACEGQRPVVAIYSTFLQRGYDQLVHDVTVQGLPVLFAIDRAGQVGEDGPTHAGSFDYSYLRCLPDMTVMAPADENECRQMLYTGICIDGPSAVRYPKGPGPGAPVDDEMRALEVGVAQVRREGRGIALLAFGSMVAPAQAIADELDATVINMRFVKPLDEAAVLQAAENHDLLVTLEENALAGGAGEAINRCLLASRVRVDVHNIGLPDRFIGQGTRGDQLLDARLDPASLLADIRAVAEERTRQRQLHA
ncbi:MAG: 1-deoxy-D-xylulose-5-phosphate synthase [Halofilum sp. (in: g-proteobacteria)]|nr:1-deoxy-D-xylulose-5-phosphate synthase [Halofilum sp. (in: g-proteobacteria)]